MAEPATPEILLDSADIAARVEAVAARIAPRLADDAVAVCLLTGGLWFAADLTRSLARLGRGIDFDALWLASYGDARTSSGRCDLRAPLQRSVAGRQVLIIDDVIDSGLSLREACRHLTEAGASEILTVVFARKPWPDPRQIQPDVVAWEAPARFLVGYGMDDGGAWRGLPHIAALD